MAVQDWSTTPANNNATPPNGWPEGMAGNLVNDTARQGMADHRARWNDAQWFNYGTGTGTPSYSYVSGTSFNVPGANVTTVYHPGRRVRAVGTLTGTIYGTITASTFSTNTTVTVQWDSGQLSNETITISLSILAAIGNASPTNDSVSRNMAINPSFRIRSGFANNQVINDGSYCVDQWLLLTSGASGTRAYADGNGTAGTITITNSTGSSNRFGIMQPLVANESLYCRGRPFIAKINVLPSENNKKFRVALVEHTGAADTITRDIVNNWASTNYTAGNFFIAGLTITAVSSSFTLTNTALQTVYAYGSVGTSCNNLMMFVWSEDTIGNTATVTFADADLYEGGYIRRFSETAVSSEQEACQRFFYSTYGNNVALGAVTDTGSVRMNTVIANETNHYGLNVRLPTRMRATPALSVYSTVTGTSGQVRNVTAGADIAATGVLYASPASTGFITTGAVVAAGSELALHIAADARL